MTDYFPDEYPKGRTCNRDYFFTVLNSLHPEYTDKLLLKCKEDRYALKEGDPNNDAIEITEEWEQ